MLEAYILVSYLQILENFYEKRLILGLTRAFDNSTEALTDLWKNKYAKKRLASLKKQGRVSTETHFYDDIIYLSWEETKQKYLPGREIKNDRTIRTRFRW